MGMVRRLVPPLIPCDGYAEEPRRSAERESKGDEGWVVLVPCVLLQSVSGGGPDCEYPGQCDYEYWISLCAGFDAVGVGKIADVARKSTCSTMVVGG